MSAQLLGLALLCSLACSPVLAQDRNEFEESSNPVIDSVSAAEIAASFRLKGVMVSQSGRSALVNNKLSREGDRVGGAEIIAITEGAVRILVGSREFTVRVGSPIVSEQPSEPRPGQLSLDARHASVKQGETLSHIAQRHLIGGITMNQMMMAMFDANPQAFGGNINVLREGTTLRIPDRDELHDNSPETATAAVVRHMDAWRSNDQQRTLLANEIDSSTYGPVASGETLSEITARVARNGTTMNQMMMAMFEANPQAFGGNINILYMDSVLRIPDENELRSRAPEAATAEVMRHMDLWPPDSLQQQRLASVMTGTAAPGRTERIPMSGAVLAQR